MLLCGKDRTCWKLPWRRRKKLGVGRPIKQEVKIGTAVASKSKHTDTRTLMWKQNRMESVSDQLNFPQFHSRKFSHRFHNLLSPPQRNEDDLAVLGPPTMKNNLVLRGRSTKMCVDGYRFCQLLIFIYASGEMRASLAALEAESHSLSICMLLCRKMGFLRSRQRNTRLSTGNG